MNKKLISIVALAAVSVGLAAAAPHADLVAAQKARIAEMKKSPKAKPHVAFVSNGVADFWTIAKAGAIAAGKELGCDVTVEFPGGGLGTLRVIAITDKVAAFDASLQDGVRRRPFAALRSMYVTETNADSSHVAWRRQRARGWEFRPLPDFRGGRAEEFWLGRTGFSRHNTSAPDTVLRQFAPE